MAGESASGAAERVALELMYQIREAEKGRVEYRTKDAILDLYLECRRAVIAGRRKE